MDFSFSNLDFWVFWKRNPNLQKNTYGTSQVWLTKALKVVVHHLNESQYGVCHIKLVCWVKCTILAVILLEVLRWMISTLLFFVFAIKISGKHGGIFIHLKNSHWMSIVWYQKRSGRCEWTKTRFHATHNIYFFHWEFFLSLSCLPEHLKQTYALYYGIVLLMT